MRALSIRQPWAWLIANGHKDIENRSWYTPYRGPVLIHAGKQPDDDFAPIFMPPDIVDICEKVPSDRVLQFGGIVGIAEIVDCVKESESPWFFGEYGFVIRNARPLPFFPCKGQLGFFNVEFKQANTLSSLGRE